MASDQKKQKTSFLDRAKKLGEKLLTKKNIAIAAPIVGAAAAMASKRVRDSVGDAVKSTGESMGLGGTAKTSAGKTKSASAASSGGSKKSAVAKTGATKSAAKPKKASSASAKPAAKRSRKPAAKSDSSATSQT